MAQEEEVGAPVHLALDHLGLGVDALSAAVVVREGDRRGGGLDVEVEPVGEGVQAGQAGGSCGRDPLAEEAGVARVRGQQGREGADEAREGGHLEAGGEPARTFCWLAVRLAGRVSSSRAARRGDRCGRSTLGRPWVMYSDKQVRAARVAELRDLPQQPLDREVLCAALAQVVAVGVDERGPVLRGALQPLGLPCAGVALDRVQGQVQAAGASEQAGALAEQVVDLLLAPRAAGDRAAHPADSYTH